MKLCRRNARGPTSACRSGPFLELPPSAASATAAGDGWFQGTVSVREHHIPSGGRHDPCRTSILGRVYSHSRLVLGCRATPFATAQTMQVRRGGVLNGATTAVRPDAGQADATETAWRRLRRRARRDLDGDGVQNQVDNCRSGQCLRRISTRRLGDVCDPRNDLDLDADGDLTHDKLPVRCQLSQSDLDGDGLGDACDARDDRDLDGDGVLNLNDNCPFDHNANQADTDGDGVGNVCDPFNELDLDGDGDPNASDNCPFVVNPGQEDADSDGFGDACDVGSRAPRRSRTTVRGWPTPLESVLGSVPDPFLARARVPRILASTPTGRRSDPRSA